MGPTASRLRQIARPTLRTRPLADLRARRVADRQARFGGAHRQVRVLARELPRGPR